jgi:hypothetical protein
MYLHLLMPLAAAATATIEVDVAAVAVMIITVEDRVVVAAVVAVAVAAVGTEVTVLLLEDMTDMDMVVEEEETRTTAVILVIDTTTTEVDMTDPLPETTLSRTSIMDVEEETRTTAVILVIDTTRVVAETSMTIGSSHREMEEAIGIGADPVTVTTASLPLLLVLPLVVRATMVVSVAARETLVAAALVATMEDTGRVPTVGLPMVSSAIRY